MLAPKIKICGIRDTQMAQAACEAGADYIGLVFHEASSRYVDMDTAQKIAEICHQHQVTPVAVFVEQSAQEMQNICEKAHIFTLQLHGKKSKQQHHYLSEKFTRFYALSINAQGNLIPDSEGGLLHCQPERDYILLDNEIPGSGHTFALKQLSLPQGFKIILAGGLNAHNVAPRIQQIHPAIVDVSSGVEIQAGQKSPALIQSFIQASRP